MLIKKKPSMKLVSMVREPNWDFNIYFPLLIPNYSFLLLLKSTSWLREHRHLHVTIKTNKIKKENTY